MSVARLCNVSSLPLSPSTFATPFSEAKSSSPLSVFSFSLPELNQTIY